MKPKILKFTRLDVPDIMEAAKHFENSGKLAATNDELAYLNINDDYVHRLYPLLHQHFPEAEKPDYFGEGLIGAHVTVIYPEEKTSLIKKEIGREHEFKIIDLFSAILNGKTYYALRVNAPTLIQLRREHHLPEKLCFKGHWVQMHVTIGTSYLFK